MLRLLVLLLLLANGAYFAWSQGHLLSWGMGPAQQAEPQREQQQIRPEAIRLLRPGELARNDAAAPNGAACLQAGVLDEEQAAAARLLLASWPAGSWSLEPVVEPGRWIVYLGKYPTPELAERKRAELRQQGIVFEPLSNAALEPGLSLGGHASEADAQRRLETLAERGVRAAKVVQERPEARGLKLMLPAVDEALKPRLEELRPVLNGKPLRPCR